MLEVAGLVKTYPTGDRALRGVSLSVKATEVVFVIGPSGAGKSSLIRCVNRLVEPDASFSNVSPQVALTYRLQPDRMVYALATVASDPYPNPADRKQRALIVDLKANERLPRPVPLKEMKLDRALRRMKFLARPARPRLAVSPLNEHEYNEVLRLAGVLVSPYR